MKNNDQSHPGDETIRLEGKFYTINTLIDEVSKLSRNEDRSNTLLSTIIFIVFYFSLKSIEFSSASVTGLLFAFFIPEIGRFIAMLLLGWENITFNYTQLLSPFISGKETIFSVQKAVVALSAPVFGMCVGLGLWSLGLHKQTLLLEHLTTALLLFSMVNLLPFFPFAGGDVVKNLIFTRFPRLEAPFFVLSGLALGTFFYMHYIIEDQIILGMLCFGVAGLQFSRFKLVDNMATMILFLRKDEDTFFSNIYSPGTIKRMEFSLRCFNIRDQSSLVQILHELWAKAHAVPTTTKEMTIIFVSYLLFVLFCAQTPAVSTLLNLF